MLYSNGDGCCLCSLRYALTQSNLEVIGYWIMIVYDNGLSGGQKTSFQVKTLKLTNPSNMMRVY